VLSDMVICVLVNQWSFSRSKATSSTLIIITLYYPEQPGSMTQQ